MAKRRTEADAASLLSAWTDTDTAMQIVGTSLGVFGPDQLDPTEVLATETPLRNALFDILLSLVEGRAVEMRPTDAEHYAFRWREDMAIAGVANGESTPIDLAPPSPYADELIRVRAERDAAIARAELAEALAAERLLRLNEAAAAPAPAATPTTPTPTPRRRKPAAPKPAVVEAVPAAGEPTPEPAPEPTTQSKPEPATIEPEPVAPAPEEAVAAVAAVPEPAVDLRQSPVISIPAAEAEEAAAARKAKARWLGYAIDPARPSVSATNRVVRRV